MYGPSSSSGLPTSDFKVGTPHRAGLPPPPLAQPALPADPAPKLIPLMVLDGFVQPPSSPSGCHRNGLLAPTACKRLYNTGCPLVLPHK